MTLKECYFQFGGDYEDVFFRLRTEERIEKFIIRFLKDESFQLLTDSLGKNQEEAFRAAHTLKGIAQNFSFTKLFESSAELTEALRPGYETPSADVNQLYESVKRDYYIVIEAISSYNDDK